MARAQGFDCCLNGSCFWRFVTMSSDKKQKQNSISFDLLFRDYCHMLTCPPLPPHSLVCFIHHLRPSHIDFGANWNCPFCFMLLYVFISKTKAYLSVVFVQLENVKARIVTSGQESDVFLCSALRVRWHPSLCSNVTEEQNSGVKI